MVESRPKNEGALNMRLFLKIGDLKVCQTQAAESKDLKHCISELMVDRKVSEYIDVSKKSGYNDRRGGKGGNDRRGGYNSRPGDDFERGTAKP